MGRRGGADGPGRRDFEEPGGRGVGRGGGLREDRAGQPGEFMEHLENRLDRFDRRMDRIEQRIERLEQRR